MSKLKFLKFYVPGGHFGELININKVHLSRGLKYLSNELRYLYWHGYPLKRLPSNFNPKNLIRLSLPYSNIDGQFWVDTKV
ncbi:hypothetical protein Patl1_07522 [Pistacia atlantica]|uniref:Uncharacterized protein n=1 Tax=Pistacia atlantica TaxID=434234 RepID=A0ACC1AI43_9ROSI|nr:hypothetical protein Patl1_07522 [Pistacia atlantica]